MALSPEEKAAYPECRGVLERTMGIPCTHKVLEYINQGRQIPVSDILLRCVVRFLASSSWHVDSDVGVTVFTFAYVNRYPWIMILFLAL